ncbi:MAG: hypothetical protein AB7N76_02170 [Planctomycetota bacterium]
MRVYRLLVELGPHVWTYVVAAPDAVWAWRLVQRGLDPERRDDASLEELEATGERPTGRARVVRRWLSAGPRPPRPRRVG